MLHIRDLFAIVLVVSMFIGAVHAGTVFEDGDFADVFWPEKPMEAFRAGATDGMGDLNQWYARGDEGQMEVALTGGNPGAYLHHLYWSDIRAMVGFDPSELGEGGTVGFDWIKVSGRTCNLEVRGLMNGEIVWWRAGLAKEGVVIAETVLPTVSSWTPVSRRRSVPVVHQRRHHRR